MIVDLERDGPVLMVRLTGDLDSRSSSMMAEEVLGQLDGAEEVVLDLTGVPYTSSAGLRALLLLYRQISDDQLGLALVGLAPGVRDVLSATGFLSYFLVHESVDSARAALALTRQRSA